MKDTNSCITCISCIGFFSEKGHLKGGKLLPEYYQSWANYYVRS